MKLYVVTLQDANFLGRLKEAGVFRFLTSYYDVKCGSDRVYRMFKDGDLFLDSGAFSAYTRGVNICVEEYSEFIEREGVELYANLDVITNEAATRKNQEIMERRGLSPVPVFHIDEDWGYLRELCGRYPYIALGVAGLQGTKKCTRFLEGCFAVIKDYWPIKVHGFGITTQRYLERYPFYSVDSTSATLAAGFGGIYTGDGRRIERLSWRKAEVAKRYPHMADINGLSHIERRFNNVMMQRDVIEGFCTELWARRGVVWDD